MDDMDIVNQRLREFYKERGSRLVIKDYPPGEITARDIEILIDRLAKKLSMKTHMVIADYGDEMRSTIRYEENKKRLEQGQIWRDLKALAKHLDIPVLTACQSNASAYEKDTQGMEVAAESQDKPRVSDVYITINQTADESLQNQMRLYIDKNRTGPRGGTAVVRVDHARCTIKDRD
jgi:replicative DNA helicase